MTTSFIDGEYVISKQVFRGNKRILLRSNSGYQITLTLGNPLLSKEAIEFYEATDYHYFQRQHNYRRL